MHLKALGMGPSMGQNCTNHLLAYLGWLEQSADNKERREVATRTAQVVRRISVAYNQQRKTQTLWRREEEEERDWTVTVVVLFFLKLTLSPNTLHFLE